MIVEDSNGLWTERSPIVQQSWDQHRALEVQASSPQSEETRRHRLQQRHQQPMKMQQNYQSECWQQQPVGNKRLYAAPTSRGGSKTAVRLWALRSALLRSALLHCALLWALQCLCAPPRDLDTEQDTASPLSSTTFVHQHRPLHSGIDHLVYNIFVSDYAMYIAQ